MEGIFNYHNMKHYILLFIFLVTTSLFSQVKVSGLIVDEQDEPIAFANIIFKNSIKGTTSDENGKFYLESKKTYTELSVSFIGFETNIIPLKKVNYNLKIVLKETGANLKEVVIYTGKIKKKGNPAIAILRKIWGKKRKNGIYMHPQYQYDKYEKIEFDLNNIDEKFKQKKIFKGMEFIFNKVDTSNITGKTYLPIFINEAVYKKYGKNNPKRDIEKLIANKNSGFENNQNVIEFVKQLYVDYNIYNNYLRFFDKSFTSPLSRTGPSVYNYVLTDSAFIDNKWCYNILFYPRRKNELTFRGDFWVNDSTFAVKKIQMAATRSANINWVKEIYIEQDFTVLNDSVFLLKRDHMMSDFSLNKKDKSKGVYGRRTTLYDNYNFDSIKPNDFYTERIKEYQEEVYNRSSDFWKKNRMEKLNDDEDGIYKMLDTLKTVKKFKQLYDLTGILASGYWQFIKGFDYGPIYSTFGSNDVEGTRIRIGGRSYFKQSDKLRVEGFLAYGTKDDKFKYGIAGQWMINPKNRLIISAGNRRDIEQTGVSLTTSNNVLDRSFASAAFFSRGDNFKLTNLNLTNVGLQIEPIKNLTFRLGATYKTLKSASPENFKIDYLDNNGVLKSTLNQTEIDAVITYTPGKKSIGFGVERTDVNSGRYPILYLSYTKGLKNVLNSDFDFQKLQFFYKQRFQVGGFGKLKYAVEIGKTFNDVPLSLMDVVPGNQTPFTASRTFDLLDYYEFVTDQYVSVHLEHNFNGRIFSRIPMLRKLNLREIIGARGIIGTVSANNRLINQSSITYLEPKDLYWEYHVGVDNIFKLLRVDFVFRGSHRNLPEATNFAIKGGINFYF
jgi:hypothetical protein